MCPINKSLTKNRTDEHRPKSPSHLFTKQNHPSPPIPKIASLAFVVGFAIGVVWRFAPAIAKTTSSPQVEKTVSTVCDAREVNPDLIGTVYDMPADTGTLPSPSASNGATTDSLIAGTEPDITESPATPTSTNVPPVASDLGSPAYVSIHGVPNLLAISELSGQQLVDLLEAQGFTWDTEEEAWTRGGSIFAVGTADVESLLPQEVRALGKGGEGAAVMYGLIVEGCGAPESLMNDMLSEGMVIDDYSDFDEGDCVLGIVQVPNGREYLCVSFIFPDSGECVMLVLTEAAVDTGLLSNYGTGIKTFDDLYASDS